MKAPKSQGLLLAILTLAVSTVTFLVYIPALDARAISFDDDEYLLDNGLVQNPSWHSAERFLVEVFRPSTVRGYYQPLAMISLMADYAMGGGPEKLRPFHRTSVLLHVVNTALIVILLYQLVGSAAAAAGIGLVFGVHPIAIESIPWIAERKTLLATFFALASLVFYVRYTKTRGIAAYATSLLACVLALMSKPSATPLPFFLVLLNFWPLQRLRRRSLLETLPFFLVAGVSAVITFLSQHKTYGTALMYERSIVGVVLMITHNIVFYLQKLAWPGELSWYYEYPDPFNLTHPAVLRGLIGTVILLVALAASWRWTKAWVTGWLFFFIGVLPTMSGVAFFGLIAADRFIYLPSVGILLCLAWLLTRFSSGKVIGLPARVVRTALYTGLAIWIVSLSISTHRQLGHWANSETLSRHMSQMVPECATARVGLGNALLGSGRSEEAIVEYRVALRLAPQEPSSHSGIGTALTQIGQLAEAVSHLQEAIRLEPDNARAMNNLGVALAKQNSFGEAVEQYKASLKIRPHYSQAHLNLATSLQALGRGAEAEQHGMTGVRLTPGDARARNHVGGILLRQNKAPQAIEQFQHAIRLRPGYATAHAGLGTALFSMGKTHEAIREYSEALRLQPQDAEVHRRMADACFMVENAAEAARHYELSSRIEPDHVAARIHWGHALVALNRLEEAASQFQIAAASAPKDAELRYHWGMALQQLNRPEEAISQYSEAVRLKPDLVEARNNLGAALSDQDRLEEAIVQFREALRLDPTMVALHANLADALGRQGQLSEAADQYRTALRLDPKNADLHVRFAILLSRAGQADSAVAEFQEALRLDPNLEEAKEGLQTLRNKGGGSPGEQDGSRD